MSKKNKFHCKSAAQKKAIRANYARIADNKKREKETYPHFRRYKVSNHPALIVSEHSEEEYNFRKVMHSERDGRHPNEKVYPNPNPKDDKPMYIGKRVRHDKKNRFDKRLPWKYPKK